MRDVFYFGKKPNVHPKEKFAKDLQDARNQSTTEYFWIVNEFCDYKNFDWDFDFYFLPDEDIWAEDHINVWPSQHQKDSGTWLVNSRNISPYIIYRNDVDVVFRKNIKTSNWIVKYAIDEINFDFSWHPDPTDPPFIYKWGCKHLPVEIESVIEYHVPNACDIKYMEQIVTILPNEKNWKVYHNVDKTKFDFSWIPNPYDPPYTYVWGNKWVHGEIEPTIEYIALNSSQCKYMNNDVTLLPDFKNWEIENDINVDTFDFTWLPNPKSPPYIYQFGTLIDKNDGPRYITPDNTGEIVYLHRIEKQVLKDIEVKKHFIETTLEDLCKQHPNEVFWALQKNINYTNFNFDWRPQIIDTVYELNYVHVFGSSESQSTHTYFVSSKHFLDGCNELKFVEDYRITTTNLSTIFEKPEMFFIDRYNSESEQRYLELKNKFPNIQKTRFLNSWVDTINRCCSKAKTQLFWVLNSELDYSKFNFDYYPNPWQFKMVHVFGTQWGHWGTTFMVNRESFVNDTKYVKVIEHLSNLNFVKDKRAVATNILYDIVYIDHGNIDVETIKKYKQEGKIVIEYEHDYLTTFRKILSLLPNKKDHYVWIISSICNYSTFDFTYISDPFSREHLHVFPSNQQKFGDTFLVNVNKLRDLIINMNTLEDYGKINYNNHQRVSRHSAPLIETTLDSHVNSVVNAEFNFPYAVFVTEDNKHINVDDKEPVNMWKDKKDILVTSTGGTRIIVPKGVKNYVKKELYDYPYIKTNSKLIDSNPLDIIFFSNGEMGADENYEYLLSSFKSLKNRITRIDKVNGRVASQHAAAKASNTSWYFLINAKLKVNENFDFSWQPDRLQIPKHYIFLATNPLNGLEYGHQAIVANNKNLTLLTTGKGLDFTLDSDHEVVNVNSGIARFNTSQWDTWRTAFREVIKLSNDPSKESKKRLNIWLTKAKGDYAEYCLHGAKDAVEYYDQVNGEFDKLKLSYEWDWLKKYYLTKYKNNF